MMDWLRASRDKWEYRGQKRPPFANEPGPGEESVWDYPRPPAIVKDGRLVIIRSGEIEIARSTAAVRVCETASPPTFYLPPQDINFEQLVEVQGSSLCEWKGEARYWAVKGGREVIGWDYPKPFPEFESIAGYLSFYPGRLSCTVDDELVRPQPGGFYGGWVTDEIVGPYKGEPGTGGW
ncbi:MAG: DUF427 domain-containing protein [Chloroflexota bacterium]